MHFQHFCFPCICLKSYRRDYMEWKNCLIFYAVAYWRFCSIFNANGKIILIWCIVCCYALEILKNFPFLYREESACSTEKCCRRLKGVWEDYRTTKNDFPLSFWILKSSSLLKNRARSFDYRRQSQHISPHYLFQQYGTEKCDPFHFNADPCEQLFGSIREHVLSWLCFRVEVITKLADFECRNICNCCSGSIIVSNLWASMCIPSTWGAFLSYLGLI